jgi:hypothetical protein
MLLLSACTPDQGLTRAQPGIEIAPASFDFGEVVVSNYSELGLTVQNSGTGTLTISDASVDPLSPTDFALGDWPQEDIAAGDTGILYARYTPDVEGEDYGTIWLETNVEGLELFPVDLRGMGVIPRIDLDPEVLYFGTVAPGDSYTLSTRITATGSGQLKITDVSFPEDEATAFSFETVSWEAPAAVDRGNSVSIDLTFAPPDLEEYEGELWIATNDREEPVAAVHLYGNSVDDPTENEGPVVEILDPNNGEYFLTTESAALSGYVADAEDDEEDLTCTWYADGGKADDGTVDGDGNVTGSAMLPLGDIEVELRCWDTDGAMGSDSATVVVWDEEEPLVYTLSGGDSVFDYFTVDDDVVIKLNGITIYSDQNGAHDNLPPFDFEAQVGDTLEIIAEDVNYCMKELDPLVLHWGTGDMQELNGGVCDSACETDSCYTGNYAGPWPNVFLDEEYVIAVP